MRRKKKRRDIRRWRGRDTLPARTKKKKKKMLSLGFFWGGGRAEGKKRKGGLLKTTITRRRKASTEDVWANGVGAGRCPWAHPTSGLQRKKTESSNKQKPEITVRRQKTGPTRQPPIPLTVSPRGGGRPNPRDIAQLRPNGDTNSGIGTSRRKKEIFYCPQGAQPFG